jgi:hypothetical protein
MKANGFDKPKVIEEKKKVKMPEKNYQNEGKRVLPNYFNNNSPKKQPPIGRKRKRDKIESESPIKSSEPEYVSPDEEEKPKRDKPIKAGPRVKIVTQEKAPEDDQRKAKRSKKVDIPSKRNLIIEGKRPRRKPKYMDS